MLVGVPAEAAKKHRPKPPRALSTTPVADPSVVKYGSRLVVVGTGGKVPRVVSQDGKTWTSTAPALSSRPTWASGWSMWASEVQQYNGRWLLYFAAPVAGMKSSSHCIGVAVATAPTRTFTPVGDRPLVCPPAADTPPAEDRFLAAVQPSRSPTGTTAPTPVPDPANAHGAIDPSFTVIDKRPYLLYKTDGKPSTIRILPLTANGQHAAGASRVLLRSSGVIENPVLLHRGPRWYLFTSQGDYTTCDYVTAWRASLHPLRSWQPIKARLFLGLRNTGICGPGGADIVVGKHMTLVYFAGWTCGNTRTTCAAPLKATAASQSGRQPQRRLYGLRLAFTKKHVPVIGEWLRPFAKR